MSAPRPSEADVEALVSWLIEQGGSPGSSLHSWRCEHPDRYGECDCLAESARDLLASDWLAARDAEHEREVADWKSRRDAAVEQCRHLHQDGKTREQWHLDNCGALRMVSAIEQIADEWGWISDDSEMPTRYDMWRQLRDALSARTFDRDPQRTRAEAAERDLADLRAAIKALADEWDKVAGRHFAAKDLRALLSRDDAADGGSAR